MAKQLIKVSTKLSAEQLEKLDRIKEVYSFKSTYEVIQVVMGVFISRTDVEECAEPTIDDEIDDMFASLRDHEEIEYIRPRRKLPNTLEYV